MKNLLLAVMFLFLFFGVTNAQQNSPDAPQDGETYYKTTEVDKKVIIKSKPRSQINRTCVDESGRVALRVYFHKSGQISSAKVVTPSSCSYFDEDSIKAAKKIKFEPAIKNGQPVSYTTVVVYNWNKY